MQNGMSIEVAARQAQGTSLDEAGFEALYRQHQRSVYGWILRIVRNTAAAEDLTIETFWRIYRARAHFDTLRAFEPWARRIATRAALDWLRTQRAEISEPEEYFASLPAMGRSDSAVSEEIRRGVTRAMRELPPKLRVAVLLAVIEERPQKEVADALGISVTAVKVRVFRGLRKLRRDLELQGIRP